MKKSLLAVVGLAAASVAAPAAAHASTGIPSSDYVVVAPTYATHITPGSLDVQSSADGSVQVAQDKTGHGWCDHGVATTGVAVRSLKGTKTLYVLVYRYDANGKSVNQLIPVPNVTSAGTVVKGLPAGFGAGDNNEYYVTSNLAEAQSGFLGVPSDVASPLIASEPNGHVVNKATSRQDFTSCFNLTTSPQATPTSWPTATPVVTPPTTKPSKPVMTPTKPAPTKTTTAPTKPAPVRTTTAPVKPSKPVIVPTKPAPSTSKATATATVKVTTPGGTKTTSTSGVVPVTKPVPSGGVTATATVKVPSKGVTAVATETVKPMAPATGASSSSASAVGPKVQTDGASSDSALETELAGAGVLAAIAGAGVFVARRRSN